jgi:hypothetical protein
MFLLTVTSWLDRQGREALGVSDRREPGAAAASRWAAQVSELSPNPLVISNVIATNADAMSDYALKVAPQVAVAGAGEADRVLNRIRRRLLQWWPELGMPPRII